MEFSHESVLDQCKSPEGPSLELLQKIADEFEITFDDLIDGSYDKEWIAKPTLDQSFCAEDGSKLRSSIPVIRWLESNYGLAASKSLLRALRIPVSAVKNPDQPVKLKLLCKLIQAARARGVSPNGIFEMGRSVFLMAENSAIRDALVQYRNPSDILDCFFTEMVGKFEKNYSYRIHRLQNSSMTIAVRPREERILENGENVVFDRDLSVYRWGVGAGIFGLSPYTISNVALVSEFSAQRKTELFQISWRPRIHAASANSSPSHLRLV